MHNLRSLNLAIKQYKDIKKLKLKGEVRSQIERAALSVCLNISEGNAKLTTRDKKKFFNIAYASNKEVQTLLLIIEKEALFRQADKLGAMLYLLQTRTTARIAGRGPQNAAP